MKRKATRVCVECGAKHDRHRMAQRCGPCSVSFGNAMIAAIAAVQRAIRRGEMVKAKTQTCVDCGSNACDWDHRDYRKPLDVQPVCRSCNFARGPAVWRDVTPTTAVPDKATA